MEFISSLAIFFVSVVGFSLLICSFVGGCVFGAVGLFSSAVSFANAQYEDDEAQIEPIREGPAQNIKAA